MTESVFERKKELLEDEKRESVCVFACVRERDKRGERWIERERGRESSEEKRDRDRQSNEERDRD